MCNCSCGKGMERGEEEGRWKGGKVGEKKAGESGDSFFCPARFCAFTRLLDPHIANTLTAQNSYSLHFFYYFILRLISSMLVGLEMLQSIS